MRLGRTKKTRRELVHGSRAGEDRAELKTIEKSEVACCGRFRARLSSSSVSLRFFISLRASPPPDLQTVPQLQNARRVCFGSDKGIESVFPGK